MFHHEQFRLWTRIKNSQNEGKGGKEWTAATSMYWKKLKRQREGPPFFPGFRWRWHPRGQRAAVELKMKDKIQTKVQLKPFNLSLKCMVFENASKSLTSSKGFQFKKVWIFAPKTNIKIHRCHFGAKIQIFETWDISGYFQALWVVTSGKLDKANNHQMSFS